MCVVLINFTTLIVLQKLNTFSIFKIIAATLHLVKYFETERHTDRDIDKVFIKNVYSFQGLSVPLVFQYHNIILKKRQLFE